MADVTIRTTTRQTVVIETVYESVMTLDEYESLVDTCVNDPDTAYELVIEAMESVVESDEIEEGEPTVMSMTRFLPNGEREYLL